MSQKSRILFGVAAIALTLGAIPLAAGRDLAGDVFNRSQVPSLASSGTPATGINRAAKADAVPRAQAFFAARLQNQ